MTGRGLRKRVQRLEAYIRAKQDAKIVVQFARLKKLPREYQGERHAVIVKRLPADESGNDWFEMEERPGPAPSVDIEGDHSVSGPILRVCFVEPENRELD